MPFLDPIPRPESIDALQPLLEHRHDAVFVTQLAESLTQAKILASNGRLNPVLYKALPRPYLEEWPTTFAEYVEYLVRFSCWIPRESTDRAWLDPGKHLGEHQEVYDRLCWFYWLINQPLDSLNGGVLQDIRWFAEFLTGWTKAWGKFLDSPESFSDDILQTFIAGAPNYRVQDSMIPISKDAAVLRPNNPSGWKTFNQFFARELNPGLRPIASPADNTVITVPADCTYKKDLQISQTGEIEPILIKGTHTYGTVRQLLEGSEYADAFNGGYFIHLFLGPYSYHRFHTPVAGLVEECYPLTGRVYLNVSLSDGQFLAADSADDGYEFQQARGVLTVDTRDSPHGNVGIVAVIPVGMCQVSGVNMTHMEGRACNKGDEFGYFTFGGSDIIILMQKGSNPRWNPNFTPGTTYYSHYGTELATVTPLG
jgi:phosphatidylserine decarboxylase